MKVLTGFIWQRIGKTGGCYEESNMLSGFIKGG
jgi:hypothetical protein